MKPTKQVSSLKQALESRGVKVETEHWDKHKHIDLYLPEAKLYIEVDGLHHYTDPKQIIADFSRDHYSDDDEFPTKRIPNLLIEHYLDEIADALAEVAKERSTK